MAKSTSTIPIGSFRDADEELLLDFLPESLARMLFHSPKEQGRGGPRRGTGSRPMKTDVEQAEDVKNPAVFSPPNLLFCMENKDLVDDILPTSDLNVAAFGRPYAKCEAFARELLQFANKQPDVFYDQALMPLLKQSYAIAERFFCCEEDFDGLHTIAGLGFVPNCSHGMKLVVDSLLLDHEMSGTSSAPPLKIAVLDPIYPATKSLLHYYETGCAAAGGGGQKKNAKKVELVEIPLETTVNASNDPNVALFCEDVATFLASLQRTFNDTHFQVLIADEITSQTARHLPVREVGKWCEERNVVFIVDGTQQFDFTDRRDVKERLEFVDYYVLSTHKWLGNTKTAGVVRWRKMNKQGVLQNDERDRDRIFSTTKKMKQKQIPTPTAVSAVSFGFNKQNFSNDQQDENTNNTTRDSLFLWTGMGAHYIPYICLGQALLLYEEYGARQVQFANELLDKGLALLPMAPASVLYSDGTTSRGTAGGEGTSTPPGRTGKKNCRTMELVLVQNVRERFFPSQKDNVPITANDFQNFLQKVYGIFVSVKPYEAEKLAQGCAGANSAGDHVGKCEFVAAKKTKTGATGNNANSNDMSKIRTSEAFWLRLSCWSGNTLRDFERLANLLSHNVSLQDLVKLLSIAYFPYESDKALHAAVQDEFTQFDHSSPEVTANSTTTQSGTGNRLLNQPEQISSRSPSKLSEASVKSDKTTSSSTTSAISAKTLNLLRTPTKKERTQALLRFREVLKHQFLQTFNIYERLFSTIATPGLFYRAERLRHHLIFYLGHTAVFYWNKLISAGWVCANQRLHEKFEAIFAVGVDEMSWDDLLEDNYDWCGFSVEQQENYRKEVEQYRASVREEVCRLIDEYVLEEDITVGRTNPRTAPDENNTSFLAFQPDERTVEKKNSNMKKPHQQVRDNAPLLKATCGKLVSEYILKYCTTTSATSNLGGGTNNAPLAKQLQNTMIWILLMGAEHEKIHQETSCPILSQMPLQYLNKTHRWLYPMAEVKTSSSSYYERSGNPLVPVKMTSLLNTEDEEPAVQLRFGKNHLESDFYGWDNEFDSEQASLLPFQVSQTLVSNAEFLEFVLDDGYKKKHFWTEEGWRFVQDLNVDRPRFWLDADNEVEMQTGRPVTSSVTKAELDQVLLQLDGKNKNHEQMQKKQDKHKNFVYRAMLSIIPMPWDWPAEVNQLEAAAFCKWKAEKLSQPDLRLLGHPEQLYLALHCEKGFGKNANLAGFASPTSVNVHYGYSNCSTPSEVDSSSSNNPKEKKTKIYDIEGNVWRHSISVLTLMDGFQPHIAYDDFTLPTIDGEHNFILGGSWTSIGNCANPGSRYGFRRHFYQYAGIRFCSDFGGKNLPDPTANLLAPLQELLDSGKVQWRQTIEGEICDQREYLLMSDDKNSITDDNHGSNSNTTKSFLEKNDNTCNLVQIQDYKTSLNKLPTNQTFDILLADFRYTNCEEELAALASRCHGVLLLATLHKVEQLPGFEKSDLLDSVRAEALGFFTSNGDREPERTKSHWRRMRAKGVAHLEKQTIHKHQFFRSYLSVWAKQEFAETIKKNYSPTTEDNFDSLVPDFDNANDELFLSRQGSAVSDLYREKSGMAAAVGQQVNHNQQTTVYYQDDSILASYYEFHFGKVLPLRVPNFPAATSSFCLEMCEKYGSKLNLAMDAGCGPGRSAFELLAGTRGGGNSGTNGFAKVEAFDYAEGFVDMLKQEQARLGIPEERLASYQGDAHLLAEICKNPLGTYDLVSGCNLIDRLHDPMQYLQACKKLVNPDKGLIIHCSPYTWKPEHTEIEKWVGGKFTPQMEKLFTEQALQEFMEKDNEFKLVETRKIPFVIPDTDGSFQYRKKKLLHCKLVMQKMDLRSICLGTYARQWIFTCVFH
ncbi:unnamed protein product [Amoebophrya sp. A120]|nr:unnamed protein product [Amoebophrya sp. A120]|eukprot:GSA120T00023104001.1